MRSRPTSFPTVPSLAGALCVAACGGDDPLPPGPPGPERIEAVAADGRVGLAGVPLPDSLIVVVQGAAGPLADVPVRWTALGGGEVRPETVLTDDQGRAMALWSPATGPDSVRAEVDTLSVTFRGRGDAAAPGTLWVGRNGYVDYRSGALPLVISAPHGGTEEPSEIPDRTAGTTVRDSNTDLLALALADALETRTGSRPHLVVSRLHRRKLDPNRDLDEAAGGDPRAEHAWREFQALIEHASGRVVAAHRRGLYLDLHGHGHEIPRLELGYLLDGDDLARSDAELDGGDWSASSSIRALVDHAGVPFSALLRGPESLGTLLESRGVPATPSAPQPDPGGAPYFSGGYNTARHGSRDGAPVSGIQIEAHYTGVRDTEANRAAFAALLADALAVFLARWYP